MLLITVFNVRSRLKCLHLLVLGGVVADPRVGITAPLLMVLRYSHKVVAGVLLNNLDIITKMRQSGRFQCRYCFGGNNNDHSDQSGLITHNRGAARTGGKDLVANSYIQPFCKLSVAVRGRHPSLYRQPALSFAYRRSSHAANF